MVFDLKTLVQATLKKFDVGVTRYSTLETLRQNSSAKSDIELLQRLNGDNAKLLIDCYGKSKSQYCQDVFVLSQLSFKRNGYFVEFGATNGIDLSNNYLMEKEFGWTGILAEPATVWHKALKNNRGCNIELNCVWENSNSSLTFKEVEVAEYSTINDFSAGDSHKRSRSQGKTYEVKTISLLDLLDKYQAPKHIDYLSIDTEGSEYAILKTFDFSKYSFGVITAEHNYTPMREHIHSLLTTHGYQRVLEEFSFCDDWYINATQPQP